LVGGGGVEGDIAADVAGGGEGDLGGGCAGEEVVFLS